MQAGAKTEVRGFGTAFHAEGNSAMNGGALEISDSKFCVLDDVPSVNTLYNGINPDVEFLKSGNLLLKFLESSSIRV